MEGNTVSKKELKHHTRRLSIKEGIFWSARVSFGDKYISPFAIALGAKSSIITILNSLWNLGPISQILGSKLVKDKKRKQIPMRSDLIESLGWLFIALIGLFYIKGLYLQYLPYLTILGLGVIVFAIGIGYPSWFSLMGDLVDSKYRGRWWSKRKTITSFTTIFFAIIAAIFLNHMQSLGKGIFGFIVLFIIAAIARAYCAKLIKKHYEPKLIQNKHDKYFFKHFLRDSEESNFKNFILFRSMLAFSMGLTTPIVSIYLIRYLNFDYLTYIIIALSGILFSIITLNLWGKISDEYGNFKVISITSILIPLTPFLWIISTNKLFLFFVPAIIGGTAWTAFLTASGNFIYDNVKKNTRAKAISYFNLFAGIGAFAGGIVSSILIGFLNTTWIKPICLIFIIGGIARTITVIFWIPRLKEIKKKKQMKGIRDLKRIIFKETKPTIKEDAHEIMSISRYLRER